MNCIVYLVKFVCYLFIYPTPFCIIKNKDDFTVVYIFAWEKRVKMLKKANTS